MESARRSRSRAAHPATRRSARTVVPSAVVAVLVAVATAPTAAAHEGEAHVGVPRWTFLLLVVLGVCGVALVIYLGRRRWADRPRRTVVGVLLGVAVAVVGAVGLVELQVEPAGSTPVGRDWFPLLTTLAGAALGTGSLLVGYLRWPDRPRYAALGLVLSVWILYPVLFPGPSYTNPVGYATVASVPLLVGYVLWRDVWPAVATGDVDRFSAAVGAATAVLFGVFFWFSAGLLSTRPEGVGGSDGFVTVASFANPLVIWPAVEFYLPSVPIGGAMSVGTAIVTGLLAVLVGLNAALVATVWQRDVDVASSNGALGAVAATGATACGCCGPAVYAFASVALGASASPLYWAFLDPSSPAGAVFLAASILLLAGSAISLVDRLAAAGVCRVD